jgi:hypothetical protein
VCQVSVELFSIYCLFWTTWLNTHSGVSYGLNSYLDGLQLEGTCLTILWYHYSCTIYRSRSPAGCRWVTAFQLTTLTLHLFCTDLRTILWCTSTNSNLVCMSIEQLVSSMSWHGATKRLGEYVKFLPCRVKYWLYGSLVGNKRGAQDYYRYVGGGLTAGEVCDARWAKVPSPDGEPMSWWVRTLSPFYFLYLPLFYFIIRPRNRRKRTIWPHGSHRVSIPSPGYMYSFMPLPTTEGPLRGLSGHLLGPSYPLSMCIL